MIVAWFVEAVKRAQRRTHISTPKREPVPVLIDHRVTGHDWRPGLTHRTDANAPYPPPRNNTYAQLCRKRAAAIGPERSFLDILTVQQNLHYATRQAVHC
jgi:hypothetical protein